MAEATKKVNVPSKETKEVKAETVKKETTTAKKTAAKKTATTAKKTAAKKPAAKKTAAKKAKKEAVVKTYVQYAGQSFDVEEVKDMVSKNFKAENKKVAIEKLNVYFNTDDNAVYYVVNDEFSGHIQF